VQNKAAWAVLAMLMACGESGTGLQNGTNPPPQAPQAHLTVSAARVAPGDTLTADASLSTGAGRLTYTFDWGDGDSSSGSKPVATHVYAARGTFTVMLTVLNSRGSASVTAPVAVWSDVAPVVRLSWSSGVMPNEPVIVDAGASTAVNGRIVSYTFAVLYGETRVQASPIATFAFGRPGTYSIFVTGTDEAGESATAGVGVIVGLKVAPKTRVPTEPASLFRSAAHFARDGAGTLYAIWFDAGGLAFSRSTDNGRTFEPQTTIVDAGGPFQVAPLGSGLAVSDGGVVHIAWTWNEGDFGYVLSFDAGATFTPIELFDPVDGFVSYSPSIAVSGEDRVTVSWVQAAPGPTLPASSPIATSSSGGRSYAVVSQLPAPDFRNCNTVPSILGSLQARSRSPGALAFSARQSPP